MRCSTISSQVGLQHRSFLPPRQQPFGHGCRQQHRCPGVQTKAATEKAASPPANFEPDPAPQPSPKPLSGPVSDELLKDWMAAQGSLYTEYDYYLKTDLVEGELPSDLFGGTLLLGGPGLLDAYGHNVRNVDDADGLVSSLSFGDTGSMFFRNKFVRTAAFRAEQVAARRLNRGMHDRGLLSGTNPLQPNPSTGKAEAVHAGTGAASAGTSEWDGNPQGPNQNQHPAAALFSSLPMVASTLATSWPLNPLDLAFASRANAGLLAWGSKLYALSQHALPHEITKQVLDTVGESTMGGILTGAAASLAPGYKVFRGSGAGTSSTVSTGHVSGGGYSTSGALPAGASSSSPAAALPGGSPGSALAAAAPSAVGLAAAGVQSGDMGAGATATRPAGDGRLVLMSTSQSGLDTLVLFSEVDESGKMVDRVHHREHPTPTTNQSAGRITAKVLNVRRVPNAVARTLTDFLVTDNWYIIIAPAISFNAQRFATAYMLGGCSFAECFDWDGSRPSQIHLVPRVHDRKPVVAPKRPPTPAVSRGKRTSPPPPLPPPKPQDTRTAVLIDGPPLIMAGAVNAYELDAGRRLSLDIVSQEDLAYWQDISPGFLTPGFFKGPHKPSLTRIVVDTCPAPADGPRIDLNDITGSLQNLLTRGPTINHGLVSVTNLSRRAPEHVAIAPWLTGRPHTHMYLAASDIEHPSEYGPAQVIVKLSVPPLHATPKGSSLSMAKGPTPQPSRATSPAAAGAQGQVSAPEQAGPSDANRVSSMSSTALSPLAATSSALAQPLGSMPSLPLMPRRVKRGVASETWSSGDRCFVGALTLVPKKRAVGDQGARPEEDAWLLATVADAEAKRSELLVFDAHCISQGPVARLQLPHHLPLPRSAVWVDTYLGPGRTVAAKSWKPSQAPGSPAPDVPLLP